MMIRLLLVDDQDSFRQDLATLLALEPDLTIVAQAQNGRSAIELSQHQQPDVILMDVRMPICNGIEATAAIHQRSPWQAILMLTMFDDDEYIGQALQAGALGYLLKRSPAQQIAAAVRMAHLGYGQLGPAIAAKVFAKLKVNAALADVVNQYRFSPRTLEILQLIGQGKNNQEIAQTLYLSEGTVKNYITRIFSQLEVRDRVQAALWAQQYLLN
jgi:DNA-binding NarL/FixJ family response regulator